MKALFAAAAIVLAVSALSPAARADGPRPSSENNRSGVTDPNTVAAYAYPLYQYQSPSTPAPHYEWREGYNPHGKWRSGWVLVQ